MRWLGFDWGEHLYYASDYFEQLYLWAEHLIGAGLAYVDDQPAEAMRAARGTLTEPGRDSPFRDRPVAENLDLFRRMRAGEFPNGARVLRAKIDMASPNMNLRDPVLYRILHATHPRTGDAWCIYPTYDFAHGQSDAIEGVTHSICTLEFEDHRPLYDWLIEHLPVPSRPRQYEFARLNLAYTVLSKRFLKGLVDEGRVGLGRPAHADAGRAAAARLPGGGGAQFRARVGVARANSLVDVAMFEHAVRDVLNRSAPRRMAVLRPLKLVIENYPEGQSEELDAVNHPDDPAAGSARSRSAASFTSSATISWRTRRRSSIRLAPGREVRLRYAYFVTCREVVKDAAGEVVELRCTYDPATRGGNAPTGARCAARSTGSRPRIAAGRDPALPPAVHPPRSGSGRRPRGRPQPAFAETIPDARLEPALAGDNGEAAVQFERLGYFCRDPDSAPGKPVFNRTIGLRDSYARQVRRAAHRTAAGAEWSPS